LAVVGEVRPAVPSIPPAYWAVALCLYDELGVVSNSSGKPGKLSNLCARCSFVLDRDTRNRYESCSYCSAPTEVGTLSRSSLAGLVSGRGWEAVQARGRAEGEDRSELGLSKPERYSPPPGACRPSRIPKASDYQALSKGSPEPSLPSVRVFAHYVGRSLSPLLTLAAPHGPRRRGSMS